MSESTSHREAQQLKKTQHGLCAGPEELFQLLLDPDSRFLAVLLKNKALTEDHLLTLLKRRDLSEELLRQIYKRHKETPSHRLRLALVRNPATPGALIQTLLPHLRLFELLDLCLLPGATPDQRLAAERALLQRLPTAALGNKITLARRGPATIVGELLKEGQTQICAVCLDSPRLKEAAVFQFLCGASANAETISMIARHQRWRERPNLKPAILKNKRTPAIWYRLWLPTVNLNLLKQLQRHFKAVPDKKRLIDEELKNRSGS